MSRHQEIFKLVEGLIQRSQWIWVWGFFGFGFTKDLEVDSVDLMEYIIYLAEEAYQIDIPDKDIDAMATVGDMVGYVLKENKQIKFGFTKE